MTSLIFPDVNVLLALTHDGHTRHLYTSSWYLQQRQPTLNVCRTTQMGMLRLLTNAAATGAQVKSNTQAWDIYRILERLQQLKFLTEPKGMEPLFEQRSSLPLAASRRWTDAYLSAFASAAGLQLTTFDQTLARLTPRSILLR